MADQYGLGDSLFDPAEAKIEYGGPPYLPKTLANKAVSSSYTDLVAIEPWPGHGRGTVGSIFGRKTSCRKLSNDSRLKRIFGKGIPYVGVHM